MKNTNIQKPAKNDKISIIVLIAAAAVFIVALFFIYSGDILKGEEEIFNVYGDEQVDFVKATVTDILSSEMELDETAENSYSGSQDLEVIIKSGIYKGETAQAENYFGPLSGRPVEIGDGVTLIIKTYSDGSYNATVFEYNRIPFLAFFILLFFIITAVIGGRTGLKSLIGLAFTVLCLFTVLIPLLLKGAPTVITTFAVCAYIAFVCFTILGGVRRKTMAAFLGTASGAFFAMVFGSIAQFFARVDGYGFEEAEPLLQMKYMGNEIGIRGLLTASIIICALGAVMDVSMSISSALEEIHTVNSSLGRRELFRSGMNIGRDMVGTMTNTLILAFLGSEFILIIFMYSRGLAFYRLFSTPFVSLETISGISSSIGMILAIPLTAFISSLLISKKIK